MKKFIVLLLAAATLVSLTACKRAAENEETRKEDLFSATETPASDMSDFLAKETYLGDTIVTSPHISLDAQGSHLRYRGGTAELDVTTTGSRNGKAEYGFFLLLNGIPQSFTLETAEDTSHRETAYLQTFSLEAQETQHFHLTFTPNTGKAGDVLPLTLCYMIEPSYTAVYDGYGSYGRYTEHRYQRIDRLFLHLETDAPTQAEPASMPFTRAAVSDVYRSWFVGEEQDNWGQTYHVTLYTNSTYAEQGKQVIFVPRQKDASLTLDVFGMAADWRASLFINHVPVSFSDGRTYFDFSTDAKAVTRLTLPVDVSALPENNHAYLLLAKRETGDDPYAVKGTFDDPQKIGTYYFIVGGTDEAA